MTGRDVLLRVALGCSFVCGSAAALQADTGTDFYRGKTVTYVVATSPGGGHDFYGRLVSRHMEKQLPGSTFIIRNVPGAGHLLGANTVYASKPDGLTIGTFSTGLTVSQIVGKEGVRFDLTKMSWIGKGAADTRVMLVANKSGFNSFADLKNANREIKMATGGVGAGDYNETIIVGQAFNLKLKPMLGYGGGERAMAMMRGELDGTIGGYSSSEEIGATTQGKIVLAFGDDVPNATNAREVATTEMQRKVVALLEGQGTIYRLLAGPPDIPADRLAALRKAFLDAYNSPDLRTELGKRPVSPVGGEKVAALIAEVIDQPKEVVEMLKGMTWTE